MSEHSAFKRLHIEETANEPVVGLLEQVGLPPGVVAFIRRNLRTIWIVTGIIATLVVVLSLYQSYSAYRHDKAASALTEAMKAEGAEKQELLINVVDDFGSTSSGLWARIELAHSFTADGDTEKAIEGLRDVKKTVSGKNPVMPLLLADLAGLYEMTDQSDKAIGVYNELVGYQRFSAVAEKAMGRLFEQQGNTEQAVAMYQKYLAASEQENGPGAADPDYEIIKSKMAALQN